MSWHFVRRHVLPRVVAYALHVGAGTLCLYVIGTWIEGVSLNPVREILIAAHADLLTVNAVIKRDLSLIFGALSDGMTPEERAAAARGGLGYIVIGFARMGLMLTLLPVFLAMVIEAVTLFLAAGGTLVPRLTEWLRERRAHHTDSRRDAGFTDPREARRRINK